MAKTKTKTTKAAAVNFTDGNHGEPSTRKHTQAMIPYGAIRLGANARRVMDTDALKELAASIKEQGLLQSVLLRKDPTPQGVIGDDGETYTPPQTYTLVAGFRRHAALGPRYLNVAPEWLVAANVLDSETEGADVSAANLIENLQREDLHPYDAAAAFSALVSEHDLSGVAIARRIGKSPGYVNNLIRAHRDLHPTILAMWAEHHPSVSPRVAIELSPLPHAEQLRRWDVINGKLNQYARAVADSGEDDEGDDDGKKKPGKKASAKATGSDALGRPLPTTQIQLDELIAADKVKLPAHIAKMPENVRLAYLMGVRATLVWTSGQSPGMPVIAKLAEVKRGRPKKEKPAAEKPAKAKAAKKKAA